MGDLITFAAIYSYLLLIPNLDDSKDGQELNIIHHILQTEEYMYNQNRPADSVKDFSPVLKLIKFISTELTYDNRSASVKLCLLEDYIKNNLLLENNTGLKGVVATFGAKDVDVEKEISEKEKELFRSFLLTLECTFSYSFISFDISLASNAVR